MKTWLIIEGAQSEKYDDRIRSFKIRMASWFKDTFESANYQEATFKIARSPANANASMAIIYT